MLISAKMTMKTRELFAMVADTFSDLEERKAYYNVIRTILREKGNIPVADIDIGELLASNNVDAAIAHELMMMAGVDDVNDVVEADAEVEVEVEGEDEVEVEAEDEDENDCKPETIKIIIGDRVFELEISDGEHNTNVTFEFKGIRVMVTV